jgi:hypothetical protein
VLRTLKHIFIIYLNDKQLSYIALNVLFILINLKETFTNKTVGYLFNMTYAHFAHTVYGYFS